MYVDLLLKFSVIINNPININGVYLLEKCSQQSEQGLISSPDIHMDNPFKISKNDKFISTLKAIVAPTRTAQDINKENLSPAFPHILPTKVTVSSSSNILQYFSVKWHVYHAIIPTTKIWTKVVLTDCHYESCFLNAPWHC